MPKRKDDRRSGRKSLVPRERRTGDDRRSSFRVLVDLEVDYGCEDTYLFAYITDMSAMGIFVRTNNPESIGTRLNLRFTLPGEEAPLQVEGQVTWVNAYRPGNLDNLHPGMGVKFIDLEGESKKRLMEIIRTLALLEDQKKENQKKVAE